MHLSSRSLVISRVDDSSQSWLSVGGPCSHLQLQSVQRQLWTTQQIGKLLYLFRNRLGETTFGVYKNNKQYRSFSGYAKFFPMEDFV